MKTPAATMALVMSLSASLYSQSGNINNTLGTGGTFTIKDGSTTFLSLSQTSGALSLTNTLVLPVTSGNSNGVVFKGTDRFIHDFSFPGSWGQNTFVGVNAGNFTMDDQGTVTASSRNTGIGWGSLFSLTTGSTNTALGDQSLYHVTTGSSNVAVGDGALLSNVSGSENTVLGSSAAWTLTSGSNNICIGVNALTSSTTVSNEITLGNSLVTTLRCQVTSITALSDARDKRNIRDLPLGLDFLMKVKPRLYNWDRREWYANGKPDGSKMQKHPTAGFIAQELDQVQQREQAGWLNLVLKSNPRRLEATPGNLFPIMVKAIQDLKAENDALRSELQNLRASLAEQLAKEVQSAVANAIRESASNKVVAISKTHP